MKRNTVPYQKQRFNFSGNLIRIDGAKKQKARKINVYGLFNLGRNHLGRGGKMIFTAVKYSVSYPYIVSTGDVTYLVMPLFNEFLLPISTNQIKTLPPSKKGEVHSLFLSGLSLYPIIKDSQL